MQCHFRHLHLIHNQPQLHLLPFAFALSRLLVLSDANAVLPSLLIKPESSIRFAVLSATVAEDAAAVAELAAAVAELSAAEAEVDAAVAELAAAVRLNYLLHAGVDAQR